MSSLFAPLALLSPFSCVPLAVLLAYAPHVIKIRLMLARPKSDADKEAAAAAAADPAAKAKRGNNPYDIRNPRAATEEAIASGGELGRKLSRCVNAHSNQLEMLPMFIGGVLMAHVAGVDAKLTSALATLYILTRVAYIGLYVWGDRMWKAQMRSTSWFVCLSICVTLMTLAAAKL